MPLASAQEVQTDCRQIITIEPGKRGSKPCIRGLRITDFERCPLSEIINVT